MILVDTSVWIRALATKAPYAEELDRLLRLEQVAGHELVYGELLMGDRGGRRALLADYERLSHVAMVSHADVVTLVRDHSLYGRGAGWIDIHLLASAIAGGVQLWTADPRFDTLAEERGVAYRVSTS